MLYPRILSLAFVSALLGSASMIAAQAAQWDVATVTTSEETPLGHDFRRPMAAGYYDESANKTFISFTGQNMVPQVASYDHAAGQWSDPVSVSMHPSNDDAHDYSHIFPLGDGRVGLTSSDHNSKLYFAASANPGSIDGSWSVSEVGSNLGATYPMPMTSSADNRIDILYRETKTPTDYRPINRVSSTDNGQTWSSPVPAIDYNNSRDDNLNEIYLGAMSYEADHPSASLGEGYHGSWTIAGGGPDRHDHDDYHKNMYYAYFNFADAHWYAADGTDLGQNIDDADAETYAKVFDSGPLEGNRELGETQDIGYISKAVLDGDGNYFIDNAHSEVFILSIRDEYDGAVYSVSKSIPEPGSFILLVLGVPVVLFLGEHRGLRRLSHCDRVSFILHQARLNRLA